jgi:hypothetical protein
VAILPRGFTWVINTNAADTTELDQEGEELPDKHAAWKEATVTAGQMLASIDGRLRPGHDWRMEVTDEFQNPLFVLNINAVNSRSR